MTDLIKLWIVQRQFADYRLPVFAALAEKTELTLFHTSSGRSSDFNANPKDPARAFTFPVIHVPTSRLQFFDPQLGFSFFLHARRSPRPDKVILTGDTRHLSFWMILIFGRLLGTEVYVHGHALFKKVHATWLLKTINRVIYRAVLRLCTGYIAYTEEVKNSRIADSRQRGRYVYELWSQSRRI